MVSGLLTTVRQLGRTLGVAALGVAFAAAGDPVDGLAHVDVVAAVLGLLAGAAVLLVQSAASAAPAPR